MSLHRTTCPLDCPDACGILVESTETGEFMKLRGNPEHSYSRGSLCGKTALFGELQQSPERLRTPLLRTPNGEYEEATWEAALKHIADRVSGLRGERILALDYAGNMGKVARKFPARIMNALGATRHDGGVCDNTSTVGYESILGHVIGGDLERIEEADSLLIWGADLARTVQHLQPAVQRMCKRGTPVFAIDIYRTETIRKLEKWGGTGLIIEPGTDAALALGLTRQAFERGCEDRGFLDAECVGVDAFETHVRSAHDAAWTARTCGIAGAEFERLTEHLLQAKSPFIKTGVGWTRRRNGAFGMRAVCSLAAVLGRVEALHYESSDHFALDTDCLDRPDLRTGEAEPVRQVQLGEHLDSGAFDAVFVWGHNPVATLPDSKRIRSGLLRPATFVVVHELFMTETAEVADVVLPAASFLEQSDVYASYGHRVLQYGRAACRAPGDARSNVSAFAAIAECLGVDPDLWRVSEEELCREVLAGQRERLGEDAFAQLLEGHPMKLPERDLENRGTPSGKIELANPALDPPVATYVPDEDAGAGETDRGAFRLIASPSRSTHNSTYLHSQRHLAKLGPSRCQLNPADAEELEVHDGDALTLSNTRGTVTLAVTLSVDIPRGAVHVEGLFRARDVPEHLNLNALTSPATSSLAHGNTLYSTRVNAHKARA